ncbi:hypothetical protein IAQ61_005792 [Plenodomus lingam]|uniref:uncharacterized protein n=1 Tax=Leptosphaeria maculans TaxID=5022 RepID=UPI003332B1CC|nr:hypothetical protein IAQ61_005792 [Plenodomus lingam]
MEQKAEAEYLLSVAAARGQPPIQTVLQSTTVLTIDRGQKLQSRPVCGTTCLSPVVSIVSPIHWNAVTEAAAFRLDGSSKMMADGTIATRKFFSCHRAIGAGLV